MITPFEPWHLLVVKLTPEVTKQTFSGANPEILAQLSKRGLAFTIVADDGDILGVAGAAPIEEFGTVGEVFVVAAESRRKHSRRFACDIKRILGRARQTFGTIEAVADEGVPARWFDWLGFRNVGGRRWRMAA